MSTVRILSEGATAVTAGRETATSLRITITLYELIAALQDVVGPEDTLVVAIVVHLLRCRRLTWSGQIAAVGMSL